MNFQEKKRIRHEQIAKGLKDPSKAYAAQRSMANLRRVTWELTFEQWWGIWKDYYHMRGSGKNELVMARNGDVGPYAVGNVYLTTSQGNVRDYLYSETAKKRREEKRLERYKNKVRPLWGKMQTTGRESGLVKAKNYWNGVEVQKEPEDA